MTGPGMYECPECLTPSTDDEWIERTKKSQYAWNLHPVDLSDVGPNDLLVCPWCQHVIQRREVV